MTGDTRSTALPNVPTFKEAGVPEFELASWTVMLAPKGTPAEIVALFRKRRRSPRSTIPRPARRWQSRASSRARPGRARVPHQRTQQFGRAVRELGLQMGE